MSDDTGRTGTGDGGGGWDLARLREALGEEYEVLQELGKGSVAAVYLARNRDLGRLVAIKVLLPGPAADETARLRFEREARASASLQHPGVVEVYRYGRLPDGTPYLVMRFVKGRTMEERLAAEGPLPQGDVRRILSSVASALAAAHAKGLVHRDVRPGNILWDEERGEALLSDFGIAAILATSGQDAARLTLAGEVVGDPGYQAPEQLLDEPITELTDIFAFGITGYELLTGERPWPARGNGARLVAARLTEAPRPLSALLPAVEPDLAGAIERCLAREPRHRPSASDLARILGGPRAGGSAGGDEPPDLRTLIQRRVPQIVLIAVGVGWGLMTVVDQFVERELLPDVFYRLTLAFALAGIAGSSVIAWFHGAKGRQRAPVVEYVLLGVIALAWLAASLWIALG